MGPAGEVVAGGPLQSLLLNRAMVDGVVETPRGAHFTSCVPDYGRDEEFQRRYAKSAATDESWAEFRRRFLSGDEAEYLAQGDALAGAEKGKPRPRPRSAGPRGRTGGRATGGTRPARPGVGPRPAPGAARPRPRP